MASRARTSGQPASETASARAIEVAEFLEKSPARTEKSEVLRMESSSADLAKEPESVLFTRFRLGRGGS